MDYAMRMRFDITWTQELAILAEFDKHVGRNWSSKTRHLVMSGNIKSPNVTGYQRKLMSGIPRALNEVGRRGVKIQKEKLASVTKTHSPNGIFSSIHYIVRPPRMLTGPSSAKSSIEVGQNWWYTKYLEYDKPGNSGGNTIVPTKRRALHFYNAGEGYREEFRTRVATGKRRPFLYSSWEKWSEWAADYLEKQLVRDAVTNWRNMGLK